MNVMTKYDDIPQIHEISHSILEEVKVKINNVPCSRKCLEKIVSEFSDNEMMQCDVCKMIINEPMWHCEHNDYDECDKCYQKIEK
jgi:hypothetical protein